MAADDRNVGHDAVLLFTPDGGAETAMEGDFRSWDLDIKANLVDRTAGDDGTRSYIPTVKEGSWTLEIVDARQSYKDDIQPDQEGSWEVRLEGTGSGLPVYVFPAIIESYKETMPFDDIITISVSGKMQGAFTTAIGSTQA